MQHAYADVPPSRTSAMAIVSLVTGILGCLLVTPFVAIVTGVLGIRATRDPLVRGRGMAIAGLVLGLVWLLVGIAGGAAVGLFLKNSEVPAAVARQVTADVAAGDFAAAAANANPIFLDEPTLRALHQQIAPLGSITDITLSTRNGSRVGGATKWTLSGTITFSVGGTKDVRYTLQSKPTGGFEVTSIAIQ
jgi:hypothetical protein